MSQAAVGAKVPAGQAGGGGRKMIVGKVKRLIAVSTALLAFGSVGAAAAEAGAESRGEPVRSGSILGGFFVAAGNRGPDCNETPDCLV